MSPNYPEPTARTFRGFDENALRREAFFRLPRHYIPYVIAVVVAVVYLGFLTRNYYWDGISFATSIENAGGFNRTLIHPHHLLYNVLGYALYRSAQMLGWRGRALEILQFSNAIFSVGCTLLLYRILLRIVGSLRLASVLVCAFAFSATWWKYSTDADSYIPSVFFLLIGLNLILAADKTRPIVIALVHTAAMLLHQLAVFFLPAVVVGLLLDSTYSFRARVRRALAYCSTATLTTLSINYYCFHIATGAYAPTAFAKWLTDYVHAPYGYSFSFNLWSNLRYTLRAQVRLFFEGRLKWLDGLLYLPILLLIIALAGVVTVLVLRVVQSVRRTSLKWPAFNVDGSLRPSMFVAIVWFAAYLVFLFFWYPYFTPYRIFCLPALIIAAGVFLVHKRPETVRARATTVALFVAAMTITNFLFFIFPLSHAEKYPPLDFARKLNDSWSDKTVIYFEKSNADNQLVKYFNPDTTWLKLDSANGMILEGEIRSVYLTGGSVWLETTALDVIQTNADGRQWLRGHADTRCRKELSAKGYSMTYQQVFPGDMTTNAGADCIWVASLHENSIK